MDWTNDPNPNRSKWTFEYKASEVATAAALKQAYRAARRVWWEERKAALMAEAQTNGLEVAEPVVTSYAVNAGTAPKLSIRPGLQKQLDECHGKIWNHGNAEREYAGWVQVLNANPTKTLRLKHADWLYFFGAD